jgi:hypothetical protein
VAERVGDGLRVAVGEEEDERRERRWADAEAEEGARPSLLL